MGENPNKIFNFGSLSLDNLKKEGLASKDELQKKFKIKFKKVNFIVTYHPETLAEEKSKFYFNFLFSPRSY